MEKLEKLEKWEKWEKFESGKSDQNIVMNEEFVKKNVMNAKFDPKVFMDLSIFKIGGWNNLTPSNQNLLKKFTDENETWLLIRIPNRDPFCGTQFLETHSASSDQDMKKLMSLHVNVMMQCYMRQLSADRYWLHELSGGRASWRTSMRKFTKESTTYFVRRPKICVQMGTFSRGIQNQMNIYARQRVSSWRINIALESHFEEHAKEGWERIWINFWHADQRC